MGESGSRMGSHQGAASGVPPCAPHPRRSGSVELGKGTSFNRADKAAIRPCPQALGHAFAARAFGSVPPVRILSKSVTAGVRGTCPCTERKSGARTLLLIPARLKGWATRPISHHQIPAGREPEAIGEATVGRRGKHESGSA